MRRREPSIDFRAAAGVIADGTPDSEVLQIAADDDRVLISRDVTTMPGHFARFVAQRESPRFLLIPSRNPGRLQNRLTVTPVVSSISAETAAGVSLLAL